MPSIFIDESGPFLPVSPPSPRVSCVAAVIVSSKLAPGLSRAFRSLSQSLPTLDGEVKGSRLSEAHVADVLSLLARYDALVEAITIDTGSHDAADLSAFRLRQADLIARHVTANPDPRVRRLAAELKSSLESMSNQLFVQAWLTMQLVQRAVQTSVLYYATRAPIELGRFTWRVDAKSASITSSEEFWTAFVLPTAQARSYDRPLLLVEHGDYRHFMRYMLSARPKGRSRARGGFSVHKILTEDLQFADSAGVPGLQLADVVANAITRAFNNRLEESGWLGLRNLLVGLEPQVIQMARLNPVGDGRERRLTLDPSFEALMIRLYSRRPLLSA